MADKDKQCFGVHVQLEPRQCGEKPQVKQVKAPAELAPSDVTFTSFITD